MSILVYFFFLLLKGRFQSRLLDTAKLCQQVVERAFTAFLFSFSTILNIYPYYNSHDTNRGKLNKIINPAKQLPAHVKAVTIKK